MVSRCSYRRRDAAAGAPGAYVSRRHHRARHRDIGGTDVRCRFLCHGHDRSVFSRSVLAALAFARMASAAAWPRTIGLAVSTVIGGGLLIGLIGAAFGGSGLKLLVAGWNYFLAGLSWVLTVLLAPVLEAIFSFVLWLIGDNVPPNRADRVISPQERDWWQHLEPDSVPPFVELVIQLLKYPALLAAIYLLYRLLLWAYRAHIAHIVTAAAADRESIRGEANAAADLANLALGLLPDWMFRGAADPGPRYPKDRPGITEVFALYFDMLSVACDRGLRGREFHDAEGAQARFGTRHTGCAGRPDHRMFQRCLLWKYWNRPNNCRSVAR